MSVRMHITRGKTGSRRSHHRAGAPTLTKSEDGTVRVRHFADPETGMYRGKQVLDPAKVARKAAKKAEKRADRKEAAHEANAAAEEKNAEASAEEKK